MKTATLLFCMILTTALCVAQDNVQKKDTTNVTNSVVIEQVDEHALLKYFERPENRASYKIMEGFEKSNLFDEVYNEVRSLRLKNKRTIDYILYLTVENGTARPAHFVLYVYDNDSLGINEINKLREVLMKAWFSGIVTVEDDLKRNYKVQSGFVWWGSTLPPKLTSSPPQIKGKE